MLIKCGHKLLKIEFVIKRIQIATTVKFLGCGIVYQINTRWMQCIVGWAWVSCVVSLCCIDSMIVVHVLHICYVYMCSVQLQEPNMYLCVFSLGGAPCLTYLPLSTSLIFLSFAWLCLLHVEPSLFLPYAVINRSSLSCSGFQSSSESRISMFTISSKTTLK